MKKNVNNSGDETDSGATVSVIGKKEIKIDAKSRSDADLSSANYLDIISLRDEKSTSYKTYNSNNSNFNTKYLNKSLYPSELSYVDDCETYILANTLIKKINSENHCKNGKLNPLYEEDSSTGISNNFVGIASSQNPNIIFSKVTAPAAPNSLSIFNKINTKNQKIVQFIQQSSTKF
jgi:hypothetical protein